MANIADRVESEYLVDRGLSLHGEAFYDIRRAPCMHGLREGQHSIHGAFYVLLYSLSMKIIDDVSRRRASWEVCVIIKDRNLRLGLVRPAQTRPWALKQRTPPGRCFFLSLRCRGIGVLASIPPTDIFGREGKEGKKGGRNWPVSLPLFVQLVSCKMNILRATCMHASYVPCVLAWRSMSMLDLTL